MRIACAVFLLLLTTPAIVRAGDPSTRPVDAADDAITEIACSTTVTSVHAGNGNLVVAAGDYHYHIYLPPDYSKRAGETFPCVFVFSPSGDAKPGHLADWAKRRRWLLVMLVESKNGKFDPVIGNFLAAYDDAIKRFRIQPGMLFATGQSGGARSASLCVELRPGFGGVLLQGAGLWFPINYKVTHSFKNVNPSLAVYGLFGDTDMNRSEALSMRHDLPAGTVYRWDIFTGGHQWAPVDSVEPAMEWLADQALLHGTPSAPMRAFAIRQVNADVAVAAKADATAWARYQLLEAARDLAATRSLTHEPKLKTALLDLEKLIPALAADPVVKNELDARARLDAVERAEQIVRSKAASTDMELKAAAATAASDYAKVAGDFPDTDAGRVAGRVAVYRKNESE